MSSSNSAIEMVDSRGKRLDGRSPNDLRHVRIETGILSQANGSCFIEWGGNKIMVGVYGPRECLPRHGASPYKALVKCRYNMAPFASLEEHGRSGPSRRSTELSKVIREAFEKVIIVEAFPKTQIDIYIEILQAEGGTRVASLTAAAVALADAGIPMRDMIAGVAVGKASGKLLLDLSKEEDNFGQSDMPIALSQRTKDILLLQMDGLLTKEEIEEALDMAEKGCETLAKLQGDSIRKTFDADRKEFKM